MSKQNIRQSEKNIVAFYCVEAHFCYFKPWKSDQIHKLKIHFDSKADSSSSNVVNSAFVQFHLPS